MPHFLSMYSQSGGSVLHGQIIQIYAMIHFTARLVNQKSLDDNENILILTKVVAVITMIIMS